jgi:hypothetical protein
VAGCPGWLPAQSIPWPLFSEGFSFQKQCVFFLMAIIGLVFVPGKRWLCIVFVPVSALLTVLGTSVFPINWALRLLCNPDFE